MPGWPTVAVLVVLPFASDGLAKISPDAAQRLASSSYIRLQKRSVSGPTFVHLAPDVWTSIVSRGRGQPPLLSLTFQDLRLSADAFDGMSQHLQHLDMAPFIGLAESMRCPPSLLSLTLKPAYLHHTFRVSSSLLTGLLATPSEELAHVHVARH